MIKGGERGAPSMSFGLHRFSSLLLSFGHSFALKSRVLSHKYLFSIFLCLFSSLFLSNSRSQLGGSGSGAEK